MQTKNTDKIKATNLLNEIEEIVEPCVNCGLCKSLCPVFKTLREEAYSPRGKAIILNEKILDEILFECNLCKACEIKCPLDIKVCDAVRKAREVMVLKGNELEQNQEMIKNIRKTGNPFGNKIKKDKLYCC